MLFVCQLLFIVCCLLFVVVGFWLLVAVILVLVLVVLLVLVLVLFVLLFAAAVVDVVECCGLAVVDNVRVRMFVVMVVCCVVAAVLMLFLLRFSVCVMAFRGLLLVHFLSSVIVYVVGDSCVRVIFVVVVVVVAFRDGWHCCRCCRCGGACRNLDCTSSCLLQGYKWMALFWI